MPELDGFELAAMIREHPRFQRTAIIFVSGVALTDLDRLRGYESGAVDYVPVPVVPEILRAKVARLRRALPEDAQLERLNASSSSGSPSAPPSSRKPARRKDEFLAVLAHELRNPLAAIRRRRSCSACPTCRPTAPHRGRTSSSARSGSSRGWSTTWSTCRASPGA